MDFVNAQWEQSLLNAQSRCYWTYQVFCPSLSLIVSLLPYLVRDLAMCFCFRVYMYCLTNHYKQKHHRPYCYQSCDDILSFRVNIILVITMIKQAQISPLSSLSRLSSLSQCLSKPKSHHHQYCQHSTDGQKAMSVMVIAGHRLAQRTSPCISVSF